MKTVKTADLGVFSITAIQDGGKLNMFISMNIDLKKPEDVNGEEVKVEDMRNLVTWLQSEVFGEVALPVRDIPYIASKAPTEPFERGSIKEVELDKQQYEQLELPLVETSPKLQAKEGLPTFEDRGAIVTDSELKQLRNIPQILATDQLEMVSKTVPDAKKVIVKKPS